MDIIFRSVPIGSLTDQSEADRASYMARVYDLSNNARRALFEPRTGAYIRGLSKSFNLAEQKAPVVAFTILRVAVGEKSLAQLPSLLSTELGLPNDKAQKMAQEIEKELLGPMVLETAASLDGKENDLTAVAKTDASSLGVNNVLNLKDQKKAPPPPPMPANISK